jgi:predicted amino acid-binding ACT domain protein
MTDRGTDRDTDRDSPHAALSRVAAQVITAGSPAVSYAVTHSCAPWSSPAMEPIDARRPGEQALADATTMFQVGRAGFQLHTWASESSEPDGAPPDLASRRVTYRSSALTNPGYADGSTGSTEVLVVLRHDLWLPGYADALLVAMVTAKVTDIATRNGLPVLYVKSPVSPFRNPSRRYRTDGSGEAPRASNGLAVRVILGEGTPGGRMDTFTALTEMAQDHGWSLAFADRRLGRVKGQWWAVVGTDPARFRRHRQEIADWVPSTSMQSAMLVTAVGPARLGTTAAILANLATRNVGIAAVSAMTLQGVTFVNLVLPVAPARQSRATTVSGRTVSIMDGFGLVATDCGLTTRRARGRSGITSGTAGDHRALVSGPFPAPLPKNSTTEYPLWATWKLALDHKHSQPEDVPALLLRLLKPSVAGTPRVEYQRTMLSPDNQFLGKVKIVVSMGKPNGVDDLLRGLTDLCARTTREATDELVRQRDSVHGVALVMDWRERWTRDIRLA